MQSRDSVFCLNFNELMNRVKQIAATSSLEMGKLFTNNFWAAILRVVDEKSIFSRSVDTTTYILCCTYK